MLSQAVVELLFVSPNPGFIERSRWMIEKVKY